MIAMRKNTLHGIELSVTRMETFKGNIKLGTATAFFYSFFDKVFLVTNKHCFNTSEDEEKPDNIQLLIHSSPTNIRDSKKITLNLYKNENPLWLEHKNKEVDVVALPFEMSTLYNKILIQPISRESQLPDEVILNVGDDLLLIGYPLGIYDELNNLPIARNATIASPYSVDFNGKPQFLIDAKLHNGMSGAPVITKPSTITKSVNGTKFGGLNHFIIGVYSGHNTALDLGKVWYIRLVEEIINDTSLP